MNWFVGKHEDLSSDSGEPAEKTGVTACTCNLGAEGGGRDVPIQGTH